MSKRNLWKYDETMEMLLIMQKNNYLPQFTKKHHKSMQIFQLVEKKMMQRGYKTKSAEQICVRWKNLKNLYLKVKRSNSKNEQELFPYYDEMDKLIGREENKSTAEDSRDSGNTSLALDTEESEAKELLSESACTSETVVTDNVLPPVEVSPRKPKKWNKLHGTRGSFGQLARPVSKLEASLASSKQELNDEFYRTQKRLIDYEFNLYMRKEEELIGQMQESTKTMLEDCMDRFFSNLKDIVGSQIQSGHMTFIGSYEDHLDEQHASE